MEKQQKTIQEQLEGAFTAICDGYCKYPGIYAEKLKKGEIEDADVMYDEVCDKCPLCNLL